MGFCSYSKDLTAASHTSVENRFIKEYMRLGDDGAVKTYLYGLYLCQNPQDSAAPEEAAKELNLSAEQFVEYFRFWEDFGLVEVISQSPLSVRYLPCAYTAGKPKKVRAEKYTEFNRALQALFPGRMISSSEYMKYFDCMEEYGIKPEAMLLVARYCIELKGPDISSRYILAVARNFASEGYTTLRQIEDRLRDFLVRSDDAQAVLTALGSQKKAEPEDYRLLKKWTEQLGFGLEAVCCAASQSRRSSLPKLDPVMEELYANKKFGTEEIREYLAHKSAVRSLTASVAKELGFYCPVLDTYADNFVSVWLSYGYTPESLLELAKYCFRSRKKDFEKMDALIRRLYGAGVVSAESIVVYFESEAAEQAFAAKVLRACGMTRRPNDWDRDCLATWRGWGFSDEMILLAASRAQGKNSPLPYITSVLSSWKSEGVFSPAQAEADARAFRGARTAQEEPDSRLKRQRVENYYFALRQKAEDRAEHYRKIAAANPDFSANEREIRSAEIRLAKAEALGGGTESEGALLSDLKKKRGQLLSAMGLSEDLLVPQYRCRECGDTGFDADGNVCSCYRRIFEQGSDEKKLGNILDAYSELGI